MTAASETLTAAAPAAPRPRRATVHVRELLADTLTPLAVYQRLSAASPIRFLFESVTGGEQISRFSLLGAEPLEVYRLYTDRLEVERGGLHRETLPGEPLEALERVLRSVECEPGPIPFTGGFVGYFGYDLVRLIEKLPARPEDPFDLPVALFARFDTVIAFDHARQRVLVVANEIEGEISRAAAERELARLSRLLTRDAESPRAVPVPVELPVRPDRLEGRPSMDGPTFRQAVRSAKEYISAGDIFQVVLARRWTVPEAPGALALYRALRMINPSPYMVLLELPDCNLVGASPEMLVRQAGRRVENRPIAGTRPRGADAEEDRRLAEDLRNDPKEQAEHVMLVDLGRNDIGKVGAPGSVRVESFMEVERYSHVMHLVSSVQANLDPGRSSLDSLLACFPAGTVSGAPKIRAMEIIDELEPEARGPYAGAVGYFSFTGDVDTCITIRTLVQRGGETSVTAGAGIVADSDPEREEQETENKAAALLAAVDLARELDEEQKR
ncbi:MAG: anthranilate synthase component I [Acidobacteriota bacterium]